MKATVKTLSVKIIPFFVMYGLNSSLRPQNSRVQMHYLSTSLIRSGINIPTWMLHAIGKEFLQRTWMKTVDLESGHTPPVTSYVCHPKWGHSWTTWSPEQKVAGPPKSWHKHQPSNLGKMELVLSSQWWYNLLQKDWVIALYLSDSLPSMISSGSHLRWRKKRHCKSRGWWNLVRRWFKWLNMRRKNTKISTRLTNMSLLLKDSKAGINVSVHWLLIKTKIIQIDLLIR